MIHKKHGGNYDQRKEILGKQFYICKNCYNLWNSWNKFGNPQIETFEKRENNFEDPFEKDLTETSTNSDDSDYVNEKEEENQVNCGNLTHQPSYNEEEYRIYLLTQEANGKELRTKNFEVEREQEKEKEKKKARKRKKGENERQLEQMKKKFRHNEDQIIRQKSLENGNEPLKPTIYSELLTPHSNYLVDSKQMILLLNNLHCPCGRRKELEELKENYGSFSAILNCKNCPIKQYKDNKETFYFSNKIEGMGSRKGSDTKNKARFRTENGQRKIISSVLAGNFYENYREQMEMLGVYYLKKNAYYKTIDILIEQTNCLFQDHLKENRSKMDLQSVSLLRHKLSTKFKAQKKSQINAQNSDSITRDNFSGASGNMEAEGARIFCSKHRDYINLVGVVKDGDTKLSKIFSSVWQRVKILKDRNHLLKNVRKNIEQNSKFRCVKKIKTTLTQWIRSKSETSWSSLELKIYIEMSIFHYLNNHCCCEHQESEIENRELYSLSPQLIELSDIINKLSDRSEEIFKSGSTNKCESFMNSRTKFVEKRFNITKQWGMRCQFSALNRELPEWKTILMEQLGTKTLNINKGEFNGDIELFTEVDESNEIIGFVEEDLQKEDSYNENDIKEIEEILTSGRNIIPDLMDDDVFGISFDKRLPISFTENTLLFEIDREKNK
ncbi:hypothetical protein M0812_29576 [Anaeramoeba flamelloides]|uniref:Uncharacterized protein n=1 Tax=Anaeramoeba flamelloides TaxID=1746091 RepID=A0AAV7Y5P8_9EUKA|nr:hypothetical protein M0812_29576 [Anaeramoeba flamelloides]